MRSRQDSRAGKKRGARGSSRGRRGNNNNNRGRQGGNGRCYNCNGFGHMARDCPNDMNGNGPSASNGNTGTQSRDPERRFFDKITKSFDSTIDNAQEGIRLLKSALTYAEVEGASALLYRLADRDLNGVGAIRKSLEYMTEKRVFLEGFIPLVDFLGRDDLHKPVYSLPLQSILTQIYDLPFLVPCIAEHCEKGHLTTNKERTALIWFFTVICLEHDRARKDSRIKDIAKHLEEYGGADSLQTILDGTTLTDPADCGPVSLADVRQSQSELPGGRHDNDKQDFRSISIVPTLEEFLCDADPYLPKFPSNSASTMTEAQLLDRQFRLLREDIIGPSKEQQDDPRREHLNIVHGVRIHHVESGAPVCHGESKKPVIGPTDACISFKFKIPDWMRGYKQKLKSKREKEEYWDRNRKFLPRNALVCLQRRTRGSQWTPIRFATIVRRESKELANDEPLIGLSFLTEQDTMEVLKELSSRQTPPTRLFVISGELFAYQPILRGLQMMPAIPFADEILRGKEQELPEADVVNVSTDVSPDVKTKIDMLDDVQRGAVEQALRKRVVLVQGPPGTGKTFIGVLIAQILLASTVDQILCVTYTNHALDDILEELLDAGITGIVRLGGRSRSDRLMEYNLREQASSGKAPFTREQTRRYAQLKGTIEEAEKEVKELEKALRREIGKDWWGKASKFLEECYPEDWRQLHLNPGDIEDEHGFQVQGINGVDYLWKTWLKGKAPPAVLLVRVDGPLWRLNKDARQVQKLAWQHEMYEDKRAAMATALATLSTSKTELKQLKEMADATILASAKVIGCTTTKAAMCKTLLDGLSPGIVLVEEAAEIMEPHILTSLSLGTKRLIMIGDHKQLRPKCQHYPLTVEAGSGHDLNRSLFERLAAVLPISTPEVQHRMHPDISAIPRLLTYNNLKDDPRVSAHPAPMGLPGRIVFVDHNVDEDREKDLSETIDTVSRTNSHEITMIAGIVRYVLQQGYAATDVVVLTPYLGQMMEIRNVLCKDFNVLIDDRDLAEAREKLDSIQTSISSPSVVSEKKKVAGPGNSPVRVATIDNFQGEEAKIVIVSLVRSNSKGEIGFLKEAERINVMLSRARDCEIVIGNKATFENAKGSHSPLKGGPLWKKIFKSLASSDFIYDGVPVQCQRHGNLALVKTASDFKKLCPDGGCQEMCDRELDCGHPCKKRCHVGPCMECLVACPDKCPRGHALMRACSKDPPACSRTITWRCPLRHRLSGPCWQGEYNSDCKSCLILKKESTARKAKELELQCGQEIRGARKGKGTA